MAEALVAAALAGDRRALARLMSAVEQGGELARVALSQLFAQTGRAHVIGVTGPAGSGKSTLVSALALTYRARGQTVGVVAVDPSSPFSGGALLGDRIRMQDLHADAGVFVRSMASRGSVGGLARSTMEMAQVLDACGKDVVLIETVGVGQDEVEIARAADTTLVVSVPGLGDDVQALKAGILEIADVFVVNKADRESASQLVAELRMLQSLAEARPWTVPIVQTVATAGQGIDELVEAIGRHRAYLDQSGDRQRRRADQTRRQVRAILENRLLEVVDRALDAPGWRQRLEGVAARSENPYDLAEAILRSVLQRCASGAGEGAR